MRYIDDRSDLSRNDRADAVVVKLFAISTCMPPYCAVIPGLFMIWRIVADGGLRRELWDVPFVKCLLGFVAVIIVSTLCFGDTKAVLVCSGVSAAMVVMAYLRAVTTPQGVRFFVDVAMWGSVANAIIAVVQASIYDTAGGYRSTALYYNPNYYAMISGFILVLALYQWFCGAPQKPLIIASVAAALTGLVLSNSRTGSVSAVFGVMLLILWMKTKRGALYFVLGFGAIAAVLLCFPQILRLDEVGNSFGVRTELWSLALNGIRQRPIFGQGVWAFVRVANGAAPLGEIHAHNLLLELLLSGGILGTVLLATYLYGNVRDLMRKHRAEGGRGLSSPALVLFCMTLLHGVFDVTIFIPQNAIALMIMLAVAGHAKKRPEKNE